MSDAAGVWIQRGTKVLVVKRKSGSFGLPCGKIEDGETAAQAAVREAMEETGLSVRIFHHRYIALVNKILVTTFKAIADDYSNMHPDAYWVTIDQLEYSEFPTYNLQAAKVLGVI